MEEPDFWDDPERSQEMMKELKSLKDDKETYENLETQMEDMETLIEMGYEENDPSVIEEIQEILDQFEADFESIRMKTLLSGEYDRKDAIIKLNAGAGGTESCDWAGMLYRMYCRWAEKKGFTLEVLDYLDGDEAGIKSVTVEFLDIADNLIDKFLRCYACFLCLVLNLLAMLICAGQEHHLMSLQALKACHGICCYGAVAMSDMQVGRWIINRGGYIKWFLLHQNLSFLF